MKRLLTDVQKRLSEATAPDGFPPRNNNRLFEYVDLDWGQADFYSGFPPPIKFPAALIDLLNITWSNAGAPAQIGIVELQVRIIDLILNNSSAQAPEGQRERAFAHFDLVSATNSLLHGWTGCGAPRVVQVPSAEAAYGPLIRQRCARVNRSDGLREFRLTYQVQLSGYDAVTVPVSAKAKPKIVVKNLII